MTSVLFVCLGNICRSPLAEGIFTREAERRGLDLRVDSAGTGDWHLGHPPDRRSIAVAAAYDVDIAHLRARQITAEDFERFDYVIVMDGQNLADVRALAPDGTKAKVHRLMEFADEAHEDVPDPYYGEESDFELTYRLAHAGAIGLLNHIEKELMRA